MPISTANITGNIKDLVGSAFPLGQVRITVETSQPLIADTGTGGVRLGSDMGATIESDGAVSITGLPVTTIGAPVYRLHVEGRANNQPALSLRTGWFELTASRTLEWVANNAVDITAISAETLGEFQQIRDEVQADRVAIEAVVASNDGIVEALVENPASLTSVALAETIAAQIDPAFADKGAGLVAALDQKRTAVLAILSDSTALATHGEWPSLLGAALIDRYPQTLIRHRVYNSGTSTYAAPTTIHSGASTVTGFADNFNRTASELVGSSPQIGAPWDGNLAKWSINGTAATSSASGNTIRASMTHAGEQSMDVSLSVATNANPFNCFIHYVDATNFLILEINPAGTGNVYLKTAYGSTTTIDTATFAEAGITDASATPVAVTIADFQLSGTTVSATVGSATLSASITTPQRDLYLTGTQVGFFSGGTVQVSVTDLSVSVNATAANTLDIYNGAVGSTKADYPRTRIAQMVPVDPDAVVFSYGHNHTTETPATFETALDLTIDALHATYPDTPVIIGGQNPQYAPTPDADEHNARQADLRRYTRAAGYGYAPVFEAFMTQTNPQAGVKADGVHPNATGAGWWADAVEAYLSGLSLKPTV